MGFLTPGVGAVASGVLGAGASLLGGSKAAAAQQQAAQAQLQQYGQTRADLLPYNLLGQGAMGSAYTLAQGGPTAGGPDYISQAAAAVPPTMTQAQLEQTPGYQFNLSQGLKATQAAAAARGLGVSGASLKGAATYATGMADSTYQNQFNNAQQRFTDYLNLNTGQQTNLTNQFSRLNSLASLGENAAATTGQQGTYGASNYGNYLSQAGVTSGSSLVNASNAVSGAYGNLLSYNALQQALQGSAQASTTAGETAGGSPAAFQAAWGLGQNQYVP